ncbi:preprotein translocase subunit YajC [Streptosporangium longisporum]|uniref:preprotein translocase subunit YajC n=1 Tax=Streptosporangium longisporum TaxID=46187 RepID=UPI0031E8BBA7
MAVQDVRLPPVILKRGSGPVGDSYSSLIMIALMVVVFYFLLIRPQRKRQQEQAKMQNSLTPGTGVMTTTGLFATVVAIDADDVILEIAPGVETRWVKAAIGRVLVPVDDAEEDLKAVDTAGTVDPVTPATPVTPVVQDTPKTAEQRGEDQDSTIRKP